MKVLITGVASGIGKATANYFLEKGHVVYGIDINKVENKYVAAAFKGIQACVVFLIFSAALKLFKKMKKNVFNIVVMLTTLTLVVLFSFFNITFSSIIYILFSGCLGLVIYFIGLIKDKKIEKTNKTPKEKEEE